MFLRTCHHRHGTARRHLRHRSSDGGGQQATENVRPICNVHQALFRGVTLGGERNTTGSGQFADGQEQAVERRAKGLAFPPMCPAADEQSNQKDSFLANTIAKIC